MAQKQTSLLAILALVFAIVFWPLGLVLGLIAFFRIQKAPDELGGKGLAIAALAISCVFFVGTSCLAAIAIPNFVKFQCRSKQVEAKTNLKALYVAEEAYAGENETYTDDFEALGFRPMGTKMRYEITVIEAGKSGFKAQAVTTDPDLGGDTWTIDQTGQLQNLVSGCR